jgi:hypothetical protein
MRAEVLAAFAAGKKAARRLGVMPVATEQFWWPRT